MSTGFLAAWLLLALQTPSFLPPKGADARRPSLCAARPERVDHGVGDDGALLARGASYKARFDARGATYVPRFGSKAPRNFPVTFRLESVALGEESVPFAGDVFPTRAEDAVSFDRGSVVETYSIRPDSMEQTLRFEALRGAGDLVVRYAVESELATTASDRGLAFENELGGVRYGRATAIDATGATAACATEVAEGAIELRVPERFLARASFPLVIDPVITTFVVDDASIDTAFADVAYDFLRDRYAIVAEYAFSAVDHDVAVYFFQGDGTLLAAAWANPVSERWANPKIAYSRYAAAYLVVVEAGTAGSRAIRGRIVYGTLAGSTLQLGPTVAISQDAQSGEKVNPDVGSDPGGIGDEDFMVVWERVFSSTDRDIHARLIGGGGSPAGDTFHVDDSGGTFDELPSISESCGFVGTYGIVWQRKIDATNRDIHAAKFNFIGDVQVASTPIVTGIADTAHPAASSPLFLGNRWLLVYERSLAGSTDTDVHALLMSGLTVEDSVNLSALESAAGSGTLAEFQVNPEVDCDGGGFVVAYAESYAGSATDYDVYQAKLTPFGSRLLLTSGHENLAYHASHEDRPRIACDASASGDSGFGRNFVVWDDEVSAGNRDVYGAWVTTSQFTTFCVPGVDAVACPCGNPPGGPVRGCGNSSGTGGAALVASGWTSLSAGTMLFETQGERPNALSILAQGTASANNVFGQGVRCVGGQLKRLYAKNALAGSIAVPDAGDPSVPSRSAQLGHTIDPGETLAYFVYYRDPNVLGGCPAASTFNATNAVAVTWLP